MLKPFLFNDFKKLIYFYNVLCVSKPDPQNKQLPDGSGDFVDK